MDFAVLSQFSPSHIAIILFAFIFMAIFYFVFNKKQPKLKALLTLIFGVLALLSVAGTSVYLFLNKGVSLIYLLPLQLLHVSIILVLLACFCKSNKFKSITFFIASFAAVYGLIVLDGRVLGVSTASLETALYFLPYLFLLTASFILVSNTKVRAVNFLSAYSLLVVLTVFAYVTNLSLMKYFEEASLVNYFYTIDPRDFVMNFFSQNFLPIPFVYLMPLSAVFLMFSCFTFTLVKALSPRSIAPPPLPDLPKWEMEESNDAIIKVPADDVELAVKEESENKLEQGAVTTEQSTTETTLPGIPPLEENAVNEEDEEDLQEFDSINSYLDSILPSIVEDSEEDKQPETKEETKAEEGENAENAENEKIDSEKVETENKVEDKEKVEDEQLDDKNQLVETLEVKEKIKEDQSEVIDETKIAQEKTFNIDEIINETDKPAVDTSKAEDNKTEATEEEIKQEDKASETDKPTKVREPEETEEIAAEETKETKDSEDKSPADEPEPAESKETKETVETAKKQDDYDKYTSFEDFDFMKELEDFKKMLNESDVQSSYQKEKEAKETKKDHEVNAPEKPKAENKKTSNLDLLKALKNKVDKNNY